MKNRLRQLRDEHHMTQEELAVQSGVSRQTIISLERGRYNPSIFLAHRLARVFKLQIEEVFIFEDEGGLPNE
ncbi:MAG TPA: helix-turn-helix transcriptional regulator [Syntrophomonadaceae bacterium]|nr:helix-turn-helix transcriptional regulator [Syntrophomonadaceae bacterium]